MPTLHAAARISASVAIIGALGALCSSSQAIAATAGPPPVGVIVENPVSLNPSTPNPVTIVNPAGTPSTVNIGNPDDLATAIAKAQGRQTVFSQQFRCSGGPGDTLCTFTSPPFTVPANQQVIVEYMSFQCGHTTEVKIGLVGVDLGRGNFFYFTLSPVDQQVDPIDDFSVTGGSQVVRIYAQPGDTLAPSVQAAPALQKAGSAFDCVLNLMGQTVTTQ